MTTSVFQYLLNLEKNQRPAPGPNSQPTVMVGVQQILQKYSPAVQQLFTKNDQGHGFLGQLFNKDAGVTPQQAPQKKLGFFGRIGNAISNAFTSGFTRIANYLNPKPVLAVDHTKFMKTQPVTNSVNMEYFKAAKEVAAHLHKNKAAFTQHLQQVPSLKQHTGQVATHLDQFQAMCDERAWKIFETKKPLFNGLVQHERDSKLNVDAVRDMAKDIQGLHLALSTPQQKQEYGKFLVTYAETLKKELTTHYMTMVASTDIPTLKKSAEFFNEVKQEIEQLQKYRDKDVVSQITAKCDPGVIAQWVVAITGKAEKQAIDNKGYDGMLEVPAPVPKQKSQRARDQEDMPRPRPGLGHS